GDTKLLLAGTDDDAVHRRDIGEIATDTEDDVIVLDQEIVGRIEADPAELGAAPQRDPGMRCAAAWRPRLARRRNGAEIPRDVSRRQAEAAQARDHHMGKILTDAVALLEH